ncbi:MAG: sulfite exporter TauE/SafE family protein [Bacteroidales bacterium]|jgi:sulfite exporter TauE/SafE|nr:sulfite exporter TauE/SafE family protein [Bacteroidales bacterium]MDD4086117.1 sulfite exporter TauE/SafE family protein [Bacteroidales bacterium]MDY0084431.1 sulfite exporter TauE/SafE family protein [Bacteroidales bacterium]
MIDNILFILLHADHHHFPVSAPFLIGLLASIMHVVSGPDHLAAVTPLAIENKLKSWAIGLSWGLGHTFGMLLIGVLFIYFKQYIPVDAISAYSEILVGLVLIGIGLWAFWRIFFRSRKVHAHPHSHTNAEGEVYTHVHAHDHPAQNIHAHKHPDQIRQNSFSALIIGLIHGLAGVSHLIGVLPTLAFPSNFDSAMYLTGFGLGTIAAMVIFSFLLGYVSYQSSEKAKPVIFKTIQFTGAFASLAVGVYWIALTL